MLSVKSTRYCSAFASERTATQALKALNGLNKSSTARASFVIVPQRSQTSRRQFHSTPRNQIKDIFPAPDAEHIKVTPAAWAHPVYTEDQMNTIVIAHREAKTWSDKVAFGMVKFLRYFTDLATGYKHDKAVALNQKDPAAAKQKYAMDERKYLIRNVFLESVAGVPGMVGGMLRHLNSMRRLKRDNGWIETLLEEAYNERMHLLIFLKMAQPGLFMRAMIIGAQGVFCNALFFSYLISPRTVHRFVGYLEEEAVLTYSREIADIDAGKLPKWAKMQAPDIAVQYYNLPEGKRTVRDMLLHIRADEAKHREVNHTLGNLNQKDDPNPYVSVYKDDSKPHPTKDIRYLRPVGWEREDII